MRDLNEYVFERRLSLRQLAQSPVSLARQTENVLPHIGVGFHAQGKNFPFPIR